LAQNQKRSVKKLTKTISIGKVCLGPGGVFQEKGGRGTGKGSPVGRKNRRRGGGQVLVKNLIPGKFIGGRKNRKKEKSKKAVEERHFQGNLS